VILLDTYTLIWLTEGHLHLGERARQLADEALARDELGVSAITFWGTAILHQRGRIQLVQPVEAWRRALVDRGLREWPLTGEVGIAAAALHEFHARSRRSVHHGHGASVWGDAGHGRRPYPGVVGPPAAARCASMKEMMMLHTQGHTTRALTREGHHELSGTTCGAV
jgi:PIN domain nuclease of toxin-antitoxin system